MKKYKFTDKKGSFELDNPEDISYLYFPIAGESGLKSSVTPVLSGDSKTDNNHFLLEPMSAENLHNNRNTRNFWCRVEGFKPWSVCGQSAEAIVKRGTGLRDESVLNAGFMWHTLTRTSRELELKAVTTSFVTVEQDVEVMLVEITNIGNETRTVTPTAAVPIFGRSADNIRDHRHVTSLLHRIKVTNKGVVVTPTLSFDERGHKRNSTSYYVMGNDSTGEYPVSFFPVTEEYIGEGGTYEWPEAVVNNLAGVAAGTELAGYEAVGGLRFADLVLTPGESRQYAVYFGIAEGNVIPDMSVETAHKELEKVKKYWVEKVNVEYHTGSEDFDQFMNWVSFQPVLRRIYGCSFLPHHDYGKGGRGWRDIWQDCLALLIMNPDGVRQMLLDNFQGVRIDGTNATIIGKNQGEFIADRNNITRVWMDHGVWPLITTKLYINQTGDVELLDNKITYFRDKQIHRGTKVDENWSSEDGTLLMDSHGRAYEGTVLEHLLIQTLTAFYDVGEHNHILLHGADWNDALDMAATRGESVAFTNTYGQNLRDLADIIEEYQKITGRQSVVLANEIVTLLEDDVVMYHNIDQKRNVLNNYLCNCEGKISGIGIEISIDKLAQNLRNKADFITENIRKKEWVEDNEGNGWFNGYYDNNGHQVEGMYGSAARMMLTSQVFAIMAGTADDDKISRIEKSADRYLYDRERGGYRLNTNFNELKMNMGRMFGFAYGTKENGAVFSHMTVMFANALYMHGHVKTGYKALKTLQEQAMNFEVSRIYPGIPEYFNDKGRGMYHYLTGAASWYMMTVISQMYGVKGCYGDLVLEPKLMKEQFSKEKKAEIELPFADRRWKICYWNLSDKEYGEYRIASVKHNNTELPLEDKTTAYTISAAAIRQMSTDETQCIDVFLD